MEPEKTARADLPREPAGADGASDGETGRFIKTGDNLDRDLLPNPKQKQERELGGRVTQVWHPEFTRPRWWSSGLGRSTVREKFYASEGTDV